MVKEYKETLEVNCEKIEYQGKARVIPFFEVFETRGKNTSSHHNGGRKTHQPNAPDKRKQ